MELKADKKSLKGLLSIDEQQFRIPPYQRPYSWTTEQVDDLWDDLVADIATGHFLGSIVMSTEGDAYFKFKTSAANWPVFRDFVLRAPTDLSVNTVRNYVQSVLSKLGAHCKLEAVSIALREGIIDYPSGS